MATNAQNVSAAKPKAGGAVFVAPLGTTLPTSVDEALSSDYKSLGYVSDEGVSNGTNIESETKKAWGGDSVLTTQKSKDDTYKMNLIEFLNKEVIKTVYGAANVSGELETGIEIHCNNSDMEEKVYVIDEMLRNGVKMRTVIGAAKISAMEDIVHNDDTILGYNITLATSPFNDDQDTHITYIKKSTVSG